jgi:hypothetical protein
LLLLTDINFPQYTLDVFKEMAIGGPLDAQRERRWPAPPPEPGQPAKKTVKVEDWRPEDEEDYEDIETLLRPDEGWIRRPGVPGIVGIIPDDPLPPAPPATSTEVDEAPAVEEGKEESG